MSNGNEAQETLDNLVPKRYPRYDTATAKGVAQQGVVRKGGDEVRGITAAVSDNFLFHYIDDARRALIYDAMERVAFGKGRTIINEGDYGDFFYILLSGACNAMKGDLEVPVYRYKSGSSFGELALTYDCPRGASIVALEDSILYRLDRDTFRNLLVAGHSAKEAQLIELQVKYNQVAAAARREAAVRGQPSGKSKPIQQPQLVLEQQHKGLDQGLQQRRKRLLDQKAKQQKRANIMQSEGFKHAQQNPGEAVPIGVHGYERAVQRQSDYMDPSADFQDAYYMEKQPVNFKEKEQERQVYRQMEQMQRQYQQQYQQQQPQPPAQPQQAQQPYHHRGRLMQEERERHLQGESRLPFLARNNASTNGQGKLGQGGIRMNGPRMGDHDIIRQMAQPMPEDKFVSLQALDQGAQWDKNGMGQGKLHFADPHANYDPVHHYFRQDVDKEEDGGRGDKEALGNARRRNSILLAPPVRRKSSHLHWSELPQTHKFERDRNQEWVPSEEQGIRHGFGGAAARKARGKGKADEAGGANRFVHESKVAMHMDAEQLYKVGAPRRGSVHMSSEGMFTNMNPQGQGLSGEPEDEEERWDDNNWGAGPSNPNPLRIGRKINMDHVHYRVGGSHGNPIIPPASLAEADRWNGVKPVGVPYPPGHTPDRGRRRIRAVAPEEQGVHPPGFFDQPDQQPVVGAPHRRALQVAVANAGGHGVGPGEQESWYDQAHPAVQPGHRDMDRAGIRVSGDEIKHNKWQGREARIMGAKGLAGEWEEVAEDMPQQRQRRLSYHGVGQDPNERVARARSPMDIVAQQWRDPLTEEAVRGEEHQRAREREHSYHKELGQRGDLMFNVLQNKAQREGVEYMAVGLPAAQQHNNNALLVAAGMMVDHPNNPRGGDRHQWHHNQPTDLQLLDKQLINAANDGELGMPMLPRNMRRMDAAANVNIRPGGNRLGALQMGMLR
jgi:CRP-like cAMP-binding protein